MLRYVKITCIFILWCFLFVHLWSCKDAKYNDTLTTELLGEKTSEVSIDDIQVSKKLLVLKPMEGKWYYQNTPFTGYAVTYHPNDAIAEKIGYY